MIKKLLCVLVLIISTGCAPRYLTRVYTEKQDFQYPNKETVRVSIYDIKESGKNYDTDLSLFIRSKVEDELSKKSNIILCERGESLIYIFDEMKMKMAGMIDESKSVNEFGKMLDADYVVTGDIFKDPSGAQVKLKFVNVTTATVDSIMSFNLDNSELRELSEVSMRVFPSAYYDKAMDALYKDMSASLHKLLRSHEDSKLFIAIIKGEEKKTSNIDKYINNRLNGYLNREKFPIQKNLLGDQYGFKSSLNVLEALNQVYKGNDYYIIELQQINDNKDKIKYQFVVKENKIKNPKLYYIGSFSIISNRSVATYNQIK